MRIEFVVAKCGFLVHVNEYEFDVDRTYLLKAALFWKRKMKFWSIGKGNREGNFRFTTCNDGKVAGWEFQGPIRRIDG